MNLYSSALRADRTDVVQAKYNYGIWFGAINGLLFALFAWGVDAYQLQRINGMYPWLKFLVGVVPCMIVGGLAGWISARSEKPLVAMFLWIAAAAAFAWLTVNLPLQVIPRLVTWMEPDTHGLLHYTYYEQFNFRFGVAYFWLAILAALTGLLQLPLSDSAIFSTSAFGRISPLLLSMVLMAISGNTMDNLNNELLRGPIEALNSTTRFFIEHKGEHIEPVQTRQNHLASLRTVQDLVTPKRKFIISGYDELLGDVQVLVQFQNAWVECEVLYNQPLMCKPVGETP